MTAYVLVLGVPGVLPLGLSGLGDIHFSSVPAMAWVGVLYIVIVPSILGYFLTIWALKRASSQLVAGYIYVQPLVAALIAPLVLPGEHLTLRTLVAGCGIFAGLGLVIMAERREPPIRTV